MSQLPVESASLTRSIEQSSLVVGSLSTAQDGNYQSIIGKLEVSRKVDRLLFDRIMDGATTLTSHSYNSIHIILDPVDYSKLRSNFSYFLSQVYSGLVPSGTLHLLETPPNLHELSSDLILAGFVLRSDLLEGGTVVAQKPKFLNETFQLKDKSSNPCTSISLPSRVNGDSAAKKKIWSLNNLLTSEIDAETLLTEEDKIRPKPSCDPLDLTMRRQKKACKGCTCGLAELEEEENTSRKVVILNGSIDGSAKEVTESEKQRLIQVGKLTPKVTSSCGSCFLGDAFRCAGCPYRGLPAFKPGERVEIDFSMDDI